MADTLQYLHMQSPRGMNPLNWHKQHKESLSPGDRAADTIRNGMGSWTFVMAFMLVLGLWAVLNTTDGLRHWDPYPFILLNLFLSMLAALQGAILLIAAKRMDAINAAQAEYDLRTNLAAKKEIEQLMRRQDEQMAALAEINKLLKK